MRLATMISLGASAVLGLGALVVAKVWLPDAGKKEAQVAMAPVVVAAKPIEFGTKLDEKNLAVLQVPVNAVPAGAYRTIKDVVGLDGGAPVALTAIASREMLLPAKLSGGGARPSMSAMITPGMRAYTIRVTDVAGGGGHVLPGDRVDVLLARKLPDGGEQAVEADVVLQNVRILGINMNADQTTTDKASPKTATLEVTVADAGRLTVASEIGSLSLALRRTGAAEVEPVRAIRTADVGAYVPRRLNTADAPPAPPSGEAPVRPRRPAMPGLVVVNGTVRSSPSSEAGA
ncbi:MAG TPA: Flp pilus assembly protein CpaB [Caulobacteraceae bacterium]